MATALYFNTRYFDTYGAQAAYGLELGGAAEVAGGDPVEVKLGYKKTVAYDNGPDEDRVHLKHQHVLPGTSDNVYCSFTGAAAHVVGDRYVNSVVGTNQGDVIEGEGGDDVLIGRGGDDRLLGGANNDVLSDESGSNYMDGGAGYDQIYFAGKLASYTVTINGGDATVSTGSFTDQILNAEALIFSDRTINLYELSTGLTMAIDGDRLVIAGDSAEGPDHGLVQLNETTDAQRHVTFDLTDNGEIAIHTTLSAPSGEPAIVDASGLHGTGLAYESRGTIIGSEQADDLYGFGFGAILRGNGGDDLLRCESAATMTGGDGDDRLLAGSGNFNDTLVGGAGNDIIDGSNGIDTASYSGNLADYVITVHKGILTIADARADSPDGTDTVGNVEDFMFADGEYSIREVLEHVSSQGPIGDRAFLLGAAMSGTVDGALAVPAYEHALVHHAVQLA